MHLGVGWKALGAVLFIAAAGAASSGAGTAEAARSVARPVPSLEPVQTAREWKRIVSRPRVHALTAGECRPVRLVFYAATDWLRLATKLAGTASPCAQYYVSIPPVVADKTQFRLDQAWRIRALGPNMHAVAEVSMNAWAGWVTNNAGTWHAAGVEARRRLAAAGFDVAAGDSWAVNEFSSAVRRGDGSARANAREFVRGLHDGDGSAPTKGIVFISGMSQATTNLSVYQQYMQAWLTDAPFWEDMARYVRDWSQEQYGDVRNVLVPGAPLTARRDGLVDYLDHQLVLARVAPPEAAAARAFLETASSPLANAAWRWDAAFGWTNVDSEPMQHFISTQVYALRHFRSTALPDGTVGSAGFAWAPKNLLVADDFTTRSAELLDRLAAALRDSGYDASPEDPAVAACAGTWCAGDQPDGWLNTGWQSFRAWQPPPPPAEPTPPADTTPPETTITAAPVGTVATRSATVSFSSEEGARFECALDGAAFAACVSPVSYSGLADGVHSVTVRAIDAAGNVDASPAQAAWAVDATAPDTRFTSVPPSSTKDRSATFYFAATEAGTFECSLDGRAWAACSSPVRLTSLSRTYHTFQVRARDAVGNVDATPASYTWRVR